MIQEVNRMVYDLDDIYELLKQISKQLKDIEDLIEVILERK